MTDAELHDLMHQLYLHERRKVIAYLLRGNDVGCFSTDQYIAAWNKVVSKGQSIMYDKLARRHLTTSRRVREVKPDVWADSACPSPADGVE